MIRYLFTVVLMGLPGIALAQEATQAEALQHSIDQLRTSIGKWNVVTEFLNEDGSVANSVTGSYEFSWIVPDRVVVGKSEIPEMEQAAGLLFYIGEAQSRIEMVSVGGDGRLWIMTGPLGGEQRLSQEFETAEGGTRQLRFTRFNVSDNAFESRMEYTDDGGKTWKPGNHQTFRRAGRRRKCRDGKTLCRGIQPTRRR